MFESILLPVNSLKANCKATQNGIKSFKNRISHLTILSLSECKIYAINGSETITYALNIFKDLNYPDKLSCNILYRQSKNHALVICEIAQKLNVDLIVMGAKEINLLTDYKTTTSRVLKKAHCPVLIIP